MRIKKGAQYLRARRGACALASYKIAGLFVCKASQRTLRCSRGDTKGVKSRFESEEIKTIGNAKRFPSFNKNAIAKSNVPKRRRVAVEKLLNASIWKASDGIVAALSLGQPMLPKISAAIQPEV